MNDFAKKSIIARGRKENRGQHIRLDFREESFVGVADGRQGVGPHMGGSRKDTCKLDAEWITRW